MKAVYLNKFGSPDEAFEMKEVESPKPSSNQVLIEVEGFGLNFADVLARKGLYPEVPDRPCVLGYEVVGKVKEVGSEAPDHLVGKRVVGLTRFGGYAQEAVTDYRAVGVVPESMELGSALALATQYTTAYISAVESLNLYEGDRVLVHAGAGGVGIALCQIALSKGCEVFATAGSDEKLHFLKSLGVQHPINYRKTDYAQAVKSILKDKRLDVSFNSLAGKSVKKDLKLLGSGGKFVIYGAASRVGKSGGFFAGLRLLWDTGFITPLAMIMRSKSIIGINVLKLGDYKPQLIAKCMQEVITMADSGKLSPVAKVYSIDELNKAHAELEGRRTIGKLGIRW